MSRRPLSLLAASLAVAVVAAPSALARPISDPPVAPAESPPAQSQERRSPDSIDRSQAAVQSRGTDVPAQSHDRRAPDSIDRGQAAVQARGTDVAAPDQQVVHSGPFSSNRGSSLAATAKNPLPGPPTWPVDPKPITAAQPAPVDDGGGTPVLGAALILAGTCLALFAGMRYVRPRMRNPRVVHTHTPHPRRRALRGASAVVSERVGPRAWERRRRRPRP